jgi:hypothetical protein
MTLKKVIKKHPNKICILMPALRDATTGYINSWKCIQTLENVSKLEETLEFYAKEGLRGVVAFSTCEDTEHFQNLALPPEQVAAFYRCYFNQEGGGISDGIE